MGEQMVHAFPKSINMEWNVNSLFWTWTQITDSISKDNNCYTKHIFWVEVTSNFKDMLKKNFHLNK